MTIAYVSGEVEPERWLPGLAKALPGERFEAWPDVADSAVVDIALVAAPPPGVLAKFANLKFIQSLWMGVDGLLGDASLPKTVPIARLLDPGMIAAMSETVLARVLDWHRHLYRYRALQAARDWHPLPQFMAADRSVGILGLGTLGEDVAAKLLALSFNVLGWSRRPKDVPGVACFHGEPGLESMLRRTEILVCLLPLTPATRGIISAPAIGLMREGGCIINVGRGPQVVEADLLAALDAGRLTHAYLDVFETEPLPANHAYWSHPAVTVTPHIAALTDPRTALAMVAENIARMRRGEKPQAMVDPQAGY